ncbi:neurotrimin-like [Polistes fuscatus]|uniref:neurotrimin-like n=1 Tax=Polistes fuscatus TaxID=30207 RepID=UPI001CA96200|nr:neurotrimin-like [Polistes fuscatus]
MEASYYYYYEDRTSMSKRLCTKFHERRRERSRIERSEKKKRAFTLDRIDDKREFTMPAELRDFDGERLACECTPPKSSVLKSDDAYAGDDNNDFNISSSSSSSLPSSSSTTLASSSNSSSITSNESFSSVRRIKKKSSLPIYILPRMAILFVLFVCVLMQDGQSTYAAFTTVTTTRDPEFISQIGNVTVPAGRNVKLACSVKDLGPFKVAWMLFDKSAILTVQNHVITRNPRISVSHDEHTTWYLHINNVHQDDKGKYMCQINTAAAKTQYGYLHVVVPPNIDDSQSSSDAIVREGANVTLTCKATGSPTPSIRWKRDDNSRITINKSLSVLEWDGETLEMERISRLDMGAYLCIAFNGIPPTVSKQIKVSVDFPPMLSIPHQLVGAPLGYSVKLECYTEAHPTSLNYWTREDKHMIHDSSKYKVVSTPEVPSYKTHMTLEIYDIQMEDYGAYKCVAKNPRGNTDGVIRLYKSPPPSTSPSPSTTEISRKDWEPITELNNSVYANPNSLMIHNEKSMKTKNKFQSNLNEIGKSEQKSNDLDRKRNYDWPTDNNDAAVCITTTGAAIALTMSLIMTTIIR